MDEATSDPIEGEVRLRIDGGLAYFPGLEREQVVCFRELPTSTVHALVRCAEDAGFFDQCNAPVIARPDARSYTIGLTIGEKSRQVCFSEPINDPSTAELVDAVRKLMPGC